MFNELKLSSTERAELSLALGPQRAAALLEAADGKLARAPKGELSGRQDPAVQGTGKYYTQIDDPRKGGLTRLDPMTLERLSLDGQVGAALEIIKLPILTLTPELLHPDEEVRELLQHEFDRSKVQLMSELMTSLEFGFAAAEKVFAYRDTTIERDGVTFWEGSAVVYDRLKFMHPTAVELPMGPKGEPLGFRQVSGGTAEVPEDKALIYTYGERFGNRYGNPRTRRAYKYWWWGELIYQFANRYFEDQAIPQRKIFYEPDPQLTDAINPASPLVDKNLDAALKVAEDSRSGAALAFPLQDVRTDTSQEYKRGWDMEFLQGPNKSAEFTGYLDHLDLKKMRAMFVPEKLTNQSGPGATGSYAMVESLADFFLMGEEAFAAHLLEFLAAKWARPLIDYNFGTGVVDARFAPAKLAQSNRAFLQDFMKQFYGQLVTSYQAPPVVDIEALAKDLGLPPIKRAHDGVTKQGVAETEGRLPTPKPQAGVQASRPIKLDVPGARKATYGREWETQTKAFQELLGEVYTDWANGTARALGEASPETQAVVLQERLASLQSLAVKAYREAIPAGYALGLGPTPTPDSLAALAQRLKGLEDQLARTIATVGEKIAADLPGATAAELPGLIQVRMGYVTKQAGGDYWATIVNGWVDQRAQREADPEVVHGKIRWVLDNLASHCPDCPRYAGEYDSLADLPCLPGDGTTECGIYCRCWLEEQDPATGNWYRRIHDL